MIPVNGDIFEYQDRSGYSEKTKIRICKVHSPVNVDVEILDRLRPPMKYSNWFLNQQLIRNGLIRLLFREGKYIYH